MRSLAKGSFANSKQSDQQFLCNLISYKISLAQRFCSWSNNLKTADWIT